MRLEFIDKLVGGEVLGKNILTTDGKILLRSGVKLTEIYIQKLKELGVFYIYVEDKRLDDVLVEDERLLELKQIAMKNMSKIVKNVHSCNNREMKESLSIVEDLVQYIVSLGDVNKSLYDIQTYDNYTYVHCIDTCIMASFLGMSTGISDRAINELGMGAILHDIGKTKVAYNIVNKNTSLTDEEFIEMKNHPIYGADLLRKNMRISDNVIKAVLQHHERVDGKGYPFNLQGNEISKFAKIVCVCDVYNAVSSDRSYRKSFKPNESYELILAGSGSAFDIDIVKGFKETFAVYPLGCCIKLSNGIEGYVIRQNKDFPDRPIMRVLYDSETREPVPFYEVDLLVNSSLTVEGIV